MAIFNDHKIFQNIEAFQSSNVLGNELSKLIFTNGCFDILHSGHIDCLERSKREGDILIVGLNDDDSVKRLKGSRRPIHSWLDRALVLAALGCVDFIVGFGEDTPLAMIESLRPAVITKGGDYKIERMIGKDFVASYGGKVIIFPYIEGKSTTDIIYKLEK